ncbi:hypothetical protein Mal64_11530 [Pseudobythopirellula maris]|uniref:Uncharacterized protein n=1 Tax=Pseudobythopirellula maris TaxID=2527991 RepID=A0A5C5ZU74_9BACT|nr:choice-of-anchor Q domain-containing protein [Pseudobythopirellula maris]TWT90756.1 hypothetical protein Mal64_11530 [Pseudobythopirellula maris]
MSRSTRWQWGSRPSKSRSSKRSETRHLRCEPLEDRRMLAAYVVDTNVDESDGDFSPGDLSLREAIEIANTVPGADEIIFDFGHDGPETILLTMGELLVTDSLTITGDGAELLTIDAGDGLDGVFATGDGHRVFTIDDGVWNAASEVLLGGLTLTGADVPHSPPQGAGGLYGGAVGNFFENVSIVESVIAGNSAQGGGGVASYWGKLSLLETVVRDNSALYGGGIHGFLGNISVTKSKVTGNVALNDDTKRASGGGVYIYGSYTTIESSVIDRNEANGSQAGGVAIIFSEGTRIAGSTISGNIAATEGGGLHTLNSFLDIEQSTFSGNQAGTHGGAVYANWFLELSNTTVYSNRSGTGEGISFAPDFSGAELTLRNTIVAGSTNLSGDPAADISRFPGAEPFDLIARHSLIGNLGDLPLNGANNLIGVGPRLAPLADNGGPTLTHALLPGSPALDAGDSSLVVGTGVYDQRGEPFVRIADGNDPDDVVIDIGAYEAQATPEAAPGDYNRNGVVDAADFTVWRDALGQTGLTPLTGADGDGDGQVTRADYDVWVSHFGLEFTFEPFVPEELIVSTNIDESDGNYLPGDLSLREAIEIANARAGAETITFDFGHDGPETILLTMGELAITSSMTIAGDGADLLTIDASGSDATPGVADGQGSRVFRTMAPASARRGTLVTLVGMTITGGDPNGHGGGVLSEGGLTIVDSTITGNTASGSRVDDLSYESYGHSGGGLWADGETTLQGVTINHNRAARSSVDPYGSPRGGDGGGVWASGMLTITGGEISHNAAGDGHAGPNDEVYAAHGGDGGGVWFEGSALSITDASIVENRAGDGGGAFGGSGGSSGGVYAQGDLALVNSTVGYNRSGLAEGPHYSAGNYGGMRVIGDATITGSAVTGNYAPGVERHGSYYPYSYSLAGALGGVTITGDATITDSQFTDNHSEVGTAGLRVIGDLTLLRGEVSGNDGGVSVDGAAEIEDSTITGNLANGAGGGVRVIGSLTLRRSTVADNSAAAGAGDQHDGADGGGVFVDGAATIDSSTISGNRAGDGRGNSTFYDYFNGGRGGDGGGVSLTGDGDKLITNSTISGNTAGRGGDGGRRTYGGDGGDGGGVHVFGADETTIRFSTITGNSAGAAGGPGYAGDYAGGAAGTGGGVFTTSLDPSLQLTSTIVALNVQDATAPTPVLDDLNSPGSFRTSGSIIGVDTGANFSSYSSTDQIGTAAAPIDPRLAPLGDYGGPTETHALLPDSPAIHRGVKPDIFMPPYDQRGPGFRREFGDIDVGAYEWQGVDILVDNSIDEADGDLSWGDVSLREAIAMANAQPGPNRIFFDLTQGDPNLIELTMGEIVITESLHIEGYGAESLTIDAGNGADGVFGTGDGYRVFNIDDGDDDALIDVTIEELTLTGGDVRLASGGGFGGGSGVSHGGTVYSRENLTIVDSLFIDNAASGVGGAISHREGALTITGSEFVGNLAGGDGGAVSVSHSNGTLIERSVFTANESRGRGGAINSSWADLEVRDSLMSGNTSLRNGGGISSWNHTNQPFTTLIENSTLSGNTSDQSFGGALHLYGATTTLRGSTVYANRSYNGGSIAVTRDSFPTTLLLENTIVAGGADLGGAAVGEFDSPFGVSGVVIEADYSLIGSLGTAPLTGNHALLNIDPLLGPLADNGGLTLTHAPLPGSPALDAGDPSVVFDLAEFDQRGEPFYRVQGGRIDIGAYEVQSAAPATASLSVDEGFAFFTAPVGESTEESAPLLSEPAGYATGDDALLLLTSTSGLGDSDDAEGVESLSWESGDGDESSSDEAGAALAVALSEWP